MKYSTKYERKENVKINWQRFSCGRFINRKLQQKGTCAQKYFRRPQNKFRLSESGKDYESCSGNLIFFISR